MEKNINEIINYQADSVVSREIIKKELGNVTLFAFDKGKGLSEHTAPYDALVVITDGKAEVKILGVKYELKKDEMILIPSGSIHSLLAIIPFKMLLIMIKSK